MRIIAASLMLLCAAGGYAARADEPQTASQPAPTPPAAAPAAEQTAAPAQDTAAAPRAEKGPSAPGAQPAAAADTASNALKPGLTVVGAKPELTPEEKELISRGYKLEMRHGEKYFCHREEQLGSRFEIKSCDTAQSIQAHRIESQDAVRSIQNDRSLVNH
jgi:hypothetical protein